MTAVPAAPAATTRRHAIGFWLIAATFLVAMAFSTIPTPLYTLYQARDGFPELVITLIFAAYGAGVILSLYLVGGASDWLGRRRLILAALVVEIVAAVLFLVWTEVPGLLTARLLTGIGVGALTATATAYLAELRATAHPQESGRTASAVATLVNIGGIGVGPLLAGALAQWVPAPLVVPYVVLIVALLAVAVAVLFVPETVAISDPRPAYRPQRFTLPPAGRGTFVSAAIAAFAAFAILGLFTSLAPTFIAVTLHEPSRFVAGSTTFAVFAAAAITQLVAVRLPARRQLQVAVVLIGIGLIAMTAAVLSAVLWLFILAGVIAGGGVGVQFRSAIAVAASLAEPETRGDVLALAFFIAYLGLVLPVLLVGAALLAVSTSTAFIGFAVLVGVLAVWSGIALSRHAT